MNNIAIVVGSVLFCATGVLVLVVRNERRVLRIAARALPRSARERWLAEWLADVDRGPSSLMARFFYAVGVMRVVPLLAFDTWIATSASWRRNTVRKLNIAILATAIALVALSAASASGSKSAAIALLRVGVVSPGISTLDPYTGGATPVINSLGLEGLMRIGPDLTLHPWLAQSMAHPRTDVYIYHLRHGVKFWDGHELTSEDVANALNYYRYPGSALASSFSSVKAITAPSKYTLVVTLRHPDAGFPYVAAFSEIFEKSFADAHKGQLGKPGVLTMGTGPWEFQSLDPTTGLELSANPHWWNGRVPIKHISIKFFADSTSLALAMRAGDIDVDPVNVADVQGFLAASQAKLVTGFSCTAGILGLNTKVAPWNDVHVRRAAAYAINRADIVKAQGLPGTVAVSTIILPSQLRVLASKSEVDSVLKSVPTYPHSLAKARAELAASHYPHGFTANFDTFAALTGTVQVIAADLSQVGINLKVNTVSIGQWLGEAYGSPTSREGTNYLGYACQSPDPGAFPSSLLSAASTQGPYPLNFPDYSPAKVNTLIDAGLAAPTAAKRLAIYGQLLRQVGNDVPYIPLFNSPSSAAIVHNLSWSGYNYFEVTTTPWALDITSG